METNYVLRFDVLFNMFFSDILNICFYFYSFCRDMLCPHREELDSVNQLSSDWSSRRVDRRSIMQIPATWVINVFVSLCCLLFLRSSISDADVEIDQNLAMVLKLA